MSILKRKIFKRINENVISVNLFIEQNEGEFAWYEYYNASINSNWLNDNLKMAGVKLFVLALHREKYMKYKTKYLELKKELAGK